MDFEVNLEKMYAANVSIGAWTLMGWCVREMQEKGFIAGVEDSPELEELTKAGLVKRYGKNVRLMPDVVKPLG